MNGIYLSFQDFSSDVEVGVNNKIIDQVKAFNDLGLNMKTICTMDENIIIGDYDNFELLGKFRGKINKRIKILNETRKYIKSHKTDFLFIRYFKTDLLFLIFLKKIRKKIGHIIIEIPTFPYEGELNSRKISFSFFLAMVDKITRNRLKKYVDKIVTTSEYDNIFGIETIKIENGVSLERNRLKINRPKINSITLLGVATLNKWHGYDRVIDGLKNYYSEGGKFNINFNIVGTGPELEKLKERVSSYKLYNHVHFLGVKTKEELNNEYDMADIAIGSLGIHRIGTNSVSTLKLREYTARGIPFIYSYDEKSFNGNEEFLLKFNANDNPIEIKSIIKFYEKIKDNQILSENMRGIAYENFSWNRQINKIINSI